LQLESLFELLFVVAVADAEVTVHEEMVAGHDEDAFLVTEFLHELGRVDVPRVADVGDRARFGRNPGDAIAMALHERCDQRQLVVQDLPGALEYFGAPRRLEGETSKAIR